MKQTENKLRVTDQKKQEDKNPPNTMVKESCADDTWLLKQAHQQKYLQNFYPMTTAFSSLLLYIH